MGTSNALVERDGRVGTRGKIRIRNASVANQMSIHTSKSSSREVTTLPLTRTRNTPSISVESVSSLAITAEEKTVTIEQVVHVNIVNET